ncbi:efflux RND transporter permease subunit [Thiospirillum jenense]|nr:efflux RND transporter permease subunit [Thiospirillum jenense]
MINWCLHHPIGVVMLTLAVMVTGVFALTRLNVDLLPRIIYPEIRVRVIDADVAATIMEHEVTRPLEEQLATTEGAIAVQSQTSEGRTIIDLSFQYGTDIDQALRDASAKLDRAKRSLPTTIDPPSIIKRDPFQLPVAEYIVSSYLQNAVDLGMLVDDNLSRQLLTLPGVAAAEVGGSLEREINIIVDPFRLAAVGLNVAAFAAVISQANYEISTGRLQWSDGEIGGRTSGYLTTATDIAELPVPIRTNEAAVILPKVSELAHVIDGTAEERLRIRLNTSPGVKLSIQKQPDANTVSVVEMVDKELNKLTQQGLIPHGLRVTKVEDQAQYIRYALQNATNAVVSGALLAMIVVYLFLGDLRRTLIIGSAIPIAVFVTFIFMAVFNLTFNLMTLGGLALGVGMLVDNTILMLENIDRHQRDGHGKLHNISHAVNEVIGAVVASTLTNLAAVVPFLFIGGLIGLLFQELIFTISSAIIASLVVAITLVPTLAARVPLKCDANLRLQINQFIITLAFGYAKILNYLLHQRWLIIILFTVSLVVAIPNLFDRQQEFLPELDNGSVRINLTADTGIRLDYMDQLTRQIEAIVIKQSDVMTVFTTVGGSVFGRINFENANRATIQVQLKPRSQRQMNTRQWNEQIRRLIRQEKIAGLKVTVNTAGIRGIRLGQDDDELKLRITGADLTILNNLADRMITQLKTVSGLRDVRHSSEEQALEIVIQPDRMRTANYGLDVQTIGKALQFAFAGQVVTELFDGNRRIAIRVKLDHATIATPAEIESILLLVDDSKLPIRIGDVATVEIKSLPATILHDRQSRVIDITAAFGDELVLDEAIKKSFAAIANISLPSGYAIYEDSGLELLKQGYNLGGILIALALFLVFTAMAVQYESLRNPLVILLSVPFCLIGVVIGLNLTTLSLSLPVWLGVILLVGIVVNNAILLVEFIEQRRQDGEEKYQAIFTAARLRLRPILMTTLTTVIGMLPLALANSDGAELLKPLAVTIVAGLSFSVLVSLLLVPVIYSLIGVSELNRDKQLA